VVDDGSRRPNAAFRMSRGKVPKHVRKEAEVHVYDIECPTCHAAPGEGCTNRSGDPMELPHRERNRAIRELEQQDEGGTRGGSR